MALTEEQARKRVDEEKAFYGNIGAYAVVIPFLAAVNLLTDASYLWFVWPMLGWGIGVVAQGIGVFGLPGRARGWEERRTRELMGDEASAERLQALVDRAVGERTAAPTGRVEAARLQQRIEHLEAIVTSRDWDALDTHTPAPTAPRLTLDEPDEGETEAERVARLARRVR